MLFLSEEKGCADSGFLSLLAGYLRLELHGVRVSRISVAQAGALGLSTLPAFVTEEGKALFSSAGIAEKLLDSAGLGFFAGADSREAAALGRFFAYPREFEGKTPALLEQLNSELEGRFFLAGNSIRLADLFAFVLVAQAVFAAAPKERARLSNLERWFSHVQSMDGVRQNLKEAGVPLVPKLDLRQID